MFLLQQGRVGEGPGSDRVTCQEVTDERRAEAIPCHSVLGFLVPELRPHSLCPLWNIFRGKVEVLGPPGCVVKALGYGTVCTPVLGDGVLGSAVSCNELNKKVAQAYAAEVIYPESEVAPVGKAVHEKLGVVG